jgi:transcriptional regulator PpsR
MNAFTAPQAVLGNLDAESVGALIAAAADISLIVDVEGVIRDVAFQNAELEGELDRDGSWRGSLWTERVSADSRPKVAQLLREAELAGPPKWRHLNVAVPPGPDVPVLFAALRLGLDGPVIAFGRDLRPVSALQQRLINAQQSMERDYSRFRNVETRYQLLFQTALDAVVILDAGSLSVVEANPQAQRLLAPPGRRRTGASLLDSFTPATLPALHGLLASVRQTGRQDDAYARLADGERDVRVFASLFREEATTFFLVRIVPQQQDPNGEVVSQPRSTLLRLVEHMPDGVVSSDNTGRILSANSAFLELAQLPTEEQARGEVLDRWVGRPGVDLEAMVAHLAQNGSLRLFATTLRGQYGATAEVEISAASVMEGAETRFGFVIRNVDRRLPPTPAPAAGTMARSVEQMTELIGRVPLRDLVRESTDMIERLCIEVALQMTNDNRASAAEILGLSRQSLYVKMRRYGLGELTDGEAE